MSMQKTLGGDRLGSGKRMKVNLHGYERSNHDLGYIWRSTMAPGTLVPFIVEVGLPGDTFDIDLNAFVNTHPTIGPLFGSMKLQLDVFQAPIRLYNGKLHNNKLGIGLNMSSIKLPTLELTAPMLDSSDWSDLPDPDNIQINPSCILSYLGLRGLGATTDTTVSATRSFNALPLLTYWDIYKNYYANKQEEEGVVIHNAAQTIVSNVTSISIDGNALSQHPTIVERTLGSNSVVNIVTTANQPLNQITFVTTAGHIRGDQLGTVVSSTTLLTVINYDFNRWGLRKCLNWYYTSSQWLPMDNITLQRFPLSEIDDMRELILSDTMNTNAFGIFDSAVAPYTYLQEGDGTTGACIKGVMEGLGIKTYQSDVFNNWLSTEWLDGTGGINEITAIDTTGGSFSIDTLNLSKKVYDMLNRIAVSGGTYDDWLDAVYTHERYTRTETPVYHGGLSKEIVFQEVISQSEASATNNSGNQPLGTLAGKGTLSSKHKGGKIVIKVDEPSIIMGIVSITPRIDYTQGNRWFINLKTMDDLHKPALDEIGFQELITEQMAWWSTTIDNDDNVITKSAGKQPAWINYMTNYNRAYGNFAIEGNENFMILSRKYDLEVDSDNVVITDLTTYIDPSKFNNIFAQTSLDSQNFWVQIGVDMTARRKMSAKLMPNL